MSFRLRFLRSSSVETDDMLDSTLNDETEQDFTDIEPRSHRRAKQDSCHCHCHRSLTAKLENNNGKSKGSLNSGEGLMNHDIDKNELGNCSTEDTLDSGFVTGDLVGAGHGHVISDLTNQNREDQVNVAVESHILEDFGKSVEKICYIPFDENSGVPEVDNYDANNVSGTIEYSSHHDNTDIDRGNPQNIKDHYQETVACRRNSEFNESGYHSNKNIDDYSNFSGGFHNRESSSEGDELCVKCEDDDDDLNEPLPLASGSLIAPEDNQFTLTGDLVINCDSRSKDAKNNTITSLTAGSVDNKNNVGNSPKQRCNRRIEFNLDSSRKVETGNASVFAGIVSNKSQLNNYCDKKPPCRPASLVVQSCDSVVTCDCNCQDYHRLQLPSTSMMRDRNALIAPKESTG